MLLASYAAGLFGTPGRQVRYALPGSLEEAVKTVVAVDQAEQKDHHNSSFYTGKVDRFGSFLLPLRRILGVGPRKSPATARRYESCAETR
jgi:hypothetical protein